MLPSCTPYTYPPTDLYHVSFPRDGWLSKALVYTIFLVETAQTIIITHDSFNTFVRSFGDLAAFNEMQNEWLAVPIFSALGASVLHYSHMIILLWVCQSAVRCRCTTRIASSSSRALTCYVRGSRSYVPPYRNLNIPETKIMTAIRQIALVQCVGGVVCGVQAFRIGNFGDLQSATSVSTAVRISLSQ